MIKIRRSQDYIDRYDELFEEENIQRIAQAQPQPTTKPKTKPKTRTRRTKPTVKPIIIEDGFDITDNDAIAAISDIDRSRGRKKARIKSGDIDQFWTDSRY